MTERQKKICRRIYKNWQILAFVSVRQMLKDRLKAAEYLAKIHGAFKNEVQIASAVPVVINDSVNYEKLQNLSARCNW